MSEQADQYKEKFRPDTDSALDSEVEAALGGLTVDEIIAQGPQQPQAPAGDGAQGNVKRGKVISIGSDEVFVDIGGKTQAMAPLSQFTEVKIGEEFDFVIDRYDEREGVLLLNRKGVLSTNVSWDNLDVGAIVEGMVTGMNKGGLELEIKGIRAFMPAGQVDLYFNRDISVFIGQKMIAEVTQVDKQAHNLIVSRRRILEREKEEHRQKTMAELGEGQIRRGIVRSVTDFGAFVDLGGVDGLIHISEMSHRRGRHPNEFVKIGDLVESKVLKIDKETGKISLSLKQASADPWTGAETRYATGTELTGRVTKIEPFGAFIEVEESIEGLLPISEMSWQRIRHPSDIVKVGDTIKLVVINIDPAARKLSFSLKQAGPNPWATAKEKYPVDAIVSGNVTRLVDFGAFVELEPGLEGLVHISELAAHRVKTVGDVVKSGQEVKARVLEIDPTARRISLSIRRAAEPKPLATAAAGATPAPAAAPAAKKKKKELKGGLDWNW
ncbi:MAG TPA: S1 RNA-binding domain-containing protein [Humisphaera sp.]|jgi:small subunit ribosomal protein S1|nr:S1 RNA-binding domain-containing protein [Humisphaera sp.]